MIAKSCHPMSNPTETQTLSSPRPWSRKMLAIRLYNHVLMRTSFLKRPSPVLSLAPLTKTQILSTRAGQLKELSRSLSSHRRKCWPPETPTPGSLMCSTQMTTLTPASEPQTHSNQQCLLVQFLPKLTEKFWAASLKAQRPFSERMKPNTIPALTTSKLRDLKVPNMSTIKLIEEI